MEIGNLTSTYVGDLKDAIEAEISPGLNHANADTLTLWKVSIPDNVNFEETLKTIDLGDPIVTELKIGSRKLYKYFPDQLVLEEHIRILVQRTTQFPYTFKDADREDEIQPLGDRPKHCYQLLV